MLKTTLTFARHNTIALLALLVSLGGTSYAALSVPTGSVGTRALKNRAVTPAKLNPTSIAASVKAWANLTWAGGDSWRVQASSKDIRVSTVALGELVSWRHTRFARNCMASVTPQENFAPGGPAGGYVWTNFDAHNALLQIHGVGPGGAPQSQSVTVLIICPSPGSQRVSP